ncbi:NHL repeat-containing protein [Nocardioides nitrophenolicus]|uniref:NHL repeat-containing protein n=1 Tax=Nocardioides nitrophenolicus TaxID=60489 RepID=UPI001959E43A|nr:NHL repeat-containing protein [Nocardioides nitrophenolicus]MBM7517219.1 DNA-binding beta-propeller fold protein YncE [Nocardioides nitrophenolicus]
MAVAPDGTLWSVDGHSTVNHFSASGGLLGSFTPSGLSHVQSVEVGPDGTLYLTDADTGSPSVVAYTAAGNPTGRSYTLSDEAVALGVAIAPTGEVLVTNASTDRVEVFSASGAWLRNIGSSGAGPGQLDRPDDVVVAADGSVYVADYWNHRVQRFNLAGAYLGGFGQPGQNPGQLDVPYAVDLTPQGNVVVFDKYALTEFTPSGGLVSRTNHGLSLLWDYQGMSIDAAGTVYTTRLSGLARFVPAGAGAPAGTATVKAPKKGVRVVKKKVRLTVTCLSATPCSGVLSLAVKGKPIAKSTAYLVPAGGRAKVKVTLTTKGLKVIRKKPVTKALATVTGGATKVKIRR